MAGVKADHPQNIPEVQNSEWCIASREAGGVKLICDPDWKKDNSHSVAAITASITLSPGEEKVVPLVISWDFPVVKFGDPCTSGTEWWRKYTQYFGRDSAQSFNVAKEALANYAEWERKIDRWMAPVIKSDKYPKWLKTAADAGWAYVKQIAPENADRLRALLTK